MIGSDQGKRSMPHYSIKLSHHDKRSLVWKILVATILFFAVTAVGGALHFTLSTSDPVISIWLIVVTFLSIGMFGMGYLLRDKLPERMGTKCKRFYYMGKEFGIWHWSRAQIFLADIFLVALTASIYGWAASHTIPLLVSGTGFMTIVPFLYIPLFYIPLWMEILVEGFLILISVVGFLYETRVWILSKRADFCYFEGINDKSSGMTYDCDPNDIDCHLNERYK